MRAKAIITGLSRGSNKNHLIRASLEAIAFQLNDLLTALREDLGENIAVLKADGGACANDLLMQLTADIAAITVDRPKNIESTALGAAMLAAIGCGMYNSVSDMPSRVTDKKFYAGYSPEKRETLLKGWNEAVKMCRSHE